MVPFSNSPVSTNVSRTDMLGSDSERSGGMESLRACGRLDGASPGSEMGLFLYHSDLEES